VITQDDMVAIPGGRFHMGSEDLYPEERPVREVAEAHAPWPGKSLPAPNDCRRFRPAARQAEAVDISTGHIGFRWVVRD
jgi:formylglycine-generating enzyme required for sulfatase activity